MTLLAFELMGEVLRGYQREMLGRINEAWRSCRSVMVQMPTGTGKTVLMAEIIKSLECKVYSLEIQSTRQPVLIVAHRIELIEQIKDTLDRRTEGQNVVTVTSIQKLSRAKENDPLFNRQYSLIIVDEAHHALAKTYRQLWERWPEAKFLGLTATPCRLSGEGFEDLFDVLLQGEDIQWFIDQKWLSDFEYVSARPDSLVMHQIGGLRKRGADGDYQTKEMVTVMDVPESIAHLYDSYEAFAWGKKGIVYAIDRAHASHIAEYYQSKGVRCAVIDSQTPAVERAQIVERYKASPCSVDVIVNVDIFSEGFDCPEVEFIQLARPTLSLSKYLQQVGRGMRVSEGKDCVLILDNVGLYQTFGLPTESRDWRQMFHGRMAGKGQTGEEMPIFVKPSDLQSEMTKKLVNLEMVRIKRHGERREGLEVFMRHGKYGVMKDGEVTCPAEFEHIKWLQAPYFIMGMYPYAIYNNKVAVVDQNGRDLKPGLYGKVEQEGDIFKGTALDGRTVYWDAKGGRMYDIMPQFERIQRFEVAKAGHEMFLRKCLKGFERPFRQENVYLGDHLTIMGNVLIIENDIKQTYRIRGYQAGFIYVESHDVAGYRFGEISRFGNFVSRRNQLPTDMKPYPDVRRLGLKRLTIEH